MVKEVKKRNWAIIVYPDSAPEGWKEKLASRGLKGAISPLHCNDVNEVDEEMKKPHWHVLLCFEGPTTYSNVLKIAQEMNGPSPKPMDNVKGTYEYLIHKNNPEKYQYDEKDIRLFGGFNIKDYAEPTKLEKFEEKIQIVAFIEEMGITEYFALIKLLYFMGKKEEAQIVSENVLFFNAVLKSVKHGGLEQRTFVQKKIEELLVNEQQEEKETI